MAIEEKYDEVKTLITIGKEKGYLLYDEVNDMLPSQVSSSEELDELFDVFGSEGIDVVESEEKYKELKEAGVAGFGKESVADRVELDLTPGALEKTNDPVRMYLREMGTVPLLTREGEVEIAKRIERGKNIVNRASARTIMAAQTITRLCEPLKKGEIGIRELIVINDEEITEQKLENRRKATVNAIEKVNKAYKDYKSYLKRFVKLKKRSRSYVKGKWKLGRLRINLAHFIGKIKWTEALRARIREKATEAVERIAASERRLNRLESRLNSVKGRGKAKDEERTRLRSEMRKARA